MDDDIERDLHTLEQAMYDYKSENTGENYWPKAEIYGQGGNTAYSDSLNDCTPEDIIRICDGILEERRNG